MTVPATDSDSARAAYDAIAYPGHPFPQTHPGRLAAQAKIYGLEPAPVETARVLELGCGDGGNLVPMAFALPNATFTGIDLNERALNRGRSKVTDLGLDNITLQEGDLTTLDPADLGEGEFDYVIAHGVYSWVPAEARDSLLAIARACMTPNGVTYVSYNANPGDHLRQIPRELMRHATRGIDDPDEQIEKAIAAVQTVLDAQDEGDRYGAFLTEYLTRLAERGPSGVYHDDLATWCDPVFFHEFVAHAGHQGLRYLSEADFHETSLGNHPRPVIDALDTLAGTDELEREQQLDFVRLRMYRQTLLIRSEADRAPAPVVDHFDSLHATSSIQRDPPDANLDDQSTVEFKAGEHARVTTDHPSVKKVLGRLGDAWPASVPVAELAAEDPDPVRQALIGGYASNLISLTAWAPPIAATPGTHPMTSALARYEIEHHGEAVTNLRHERINMGDDIGRGLMLLLDGTRGRDELTEAMRDLGAGDNAPERLRTSLDRLADLALLTRQTPS